LPEPAPATPQLEWLYSRRRLAARRSPANARRLLADAGGPDGAVPAVRVAGTNGKGATAVIVARALTRAGIRTGCFVSPHLESFGERISVDGVELTAAETDGLIARVRELPGAGEAGFFDLTLVMAALHFAASEADAVVLEAGVGAANDATAAWRGPVAASAVTSVDYDHVATIGPTIHRIAEEKSQAGEVPGWLVTGAQGEGLEALHDVCRRKGLAFLNGPDLVLPAEFALRGSGNRRSAAVAVALLRAQERWRVDEAAIAAALRGVSWPGRGEHAWIAGRQVIFDIAHNSSAMDLLLADLTAEPGSGDARFIFGAMRTKNWYRMLRRLPAERTFAATAASAVAIPARDLARAHPGVRACSGVPGAFRCALEETPPGGLVVVTGSAYVVGAARAWARSGAVRAA
jgi:dihydrofolate synthase/folylpolyglutamate synthase